MEEEVGEILSNLTIIKELQKQVEMLKNSRTPLPNQCWFDGSTCPYGNPEGRFDLRPTISCRLGSCFKLSETEEEIKELIFGEEGQPILLNGWLNSNEPISIVEVIEMLLREEDSRLDEDDKILLRAALKILNNFKKEEPYQVHLRTVLEGW